MTANAAANSSPQPRTRRPSQANEKDMLAAFLDWHRQTFALKCQGLTPQQLACRSGGRSRLSLLGLIRHHADGERFWFRTVMAGEDAPPLFATPSHPDAAFAIDSADQIAVDEAWNAWHSETGFATQFAAGAPDLALAGDEPGEGPVSLRWVMLHMIEEYARHNGHADLLRENIDGVVGL